MALRASRSLRHAPPPSPFVYSGALLRAVPPTFAAHALRSPPPPGAAAAAPIDNARAAAAHAAYARALEALLGGGPSALTTVPPVEPGDVDELEFAAAGGSGASSAARADARAAALALARGAPDAVFLEDTAVVVGDTAFMTRSARSSRRGEGAGVARALAARGLRVVPAPPAPAVIDGGDVVFTGRGFIVGLGARTNRAGVAALAAAFPGLAVTTVPLAVIAARAAARPRYERKVPFGGLGPFPGADGGGGEGGEGGKGAGGTGAGAARAPAPPLRAHALAHPPPLHLKSVMTMIGPSTLAVADTLVGRAAAFVVQDSAPAPRAARAGGRALTCVLVPDAPAANAVFANGRLLVRAAAEFPASHDALARYAAAEGMPRPLEVDGSELAKADGALTCCALLLHEVG